MKKAVTTQTQNQELSSVATKDKKTHAVHSSFSNQSGVAHASLNQPFEVRRRYSFDDNGGGYEGL